MTECIGLMDNKLPQNIAMRIHFNFSWHNNCLLSVSGSELKQAYNFFGKWRYLKKYFTEASSGGMYYTTYTLHSFYLFLYTNFRWNFIKSYSCQMSKVKVHNIHSFIPWLHYGWITPAYLYPFLLPIIVFPVFCKQNQSKR